MILFVAPNPGKTQSREGFMQRVAAVDALFPKVRKVYYEDLIGHKEKAKALIKAEMVYVHSIYMAEEILDSIPYVGGKMVVDLHGVVPEEEAYSGNKARAKEMSDIEAIVFKYCKNFVAVTNTMVDHFNTKYPTNKKWILLPIFEMINAAQKNIIHADDSVIYAGGAQPWQNVPEMVSAVNGSKQKRNYVILTHSPDAFKGINLSNVKTLTIKQVASDQVPEYYRGAKLGFVLRDDIIVNRVACPTKLIEYLTYGVVPVVKSSNIGDFNKLGYKYIDIEEYTEGKIDDTKIKEFIQHNYKIIEKLKETQQTGMNELVRVYSKLKNENPDLLLSIKMSEMVTKNFQLKDLFEKRHLLEENIRVLNVENDSLKEKLHDYHNMVTSMQNSKVWRMKEKLKRKG